MTRLELITRYPELCAYLMGIGSVELMNVAEERSDWEPGNDLTGYPRATTEDEIDSPEVLAGEPVACLLLQAGSLNQVQLEQIETFGLRLKRINGTMGGVLASFTLPGLPTPTSAELVDHELKTDPPGWMI